LNSLTTRPILAFSPYLDVHDFNEAFGDAIYKSIVNASKFYLRKHSYKGFYITDPFPMLFAIV
jgi:hypothetical protein